MIGMTPLTTLTHTVHPALMTDMSGVMVAPRALQTIGGRSRTPTTGRDIGNDLRVIAGTTMTQMMASERGLVIVAPQILVRRITRVEAGPVTALMITIRASVASRSDVPIVATKMIAPLMLRDLADRLMIRTVAVAVIQNATLGPRIIGLPRVLTPLASLRVQGESLYSLHTISLR